MAPASSARTYLIPLFVQTIQGYTATRAGLVLMPAGLIMVVVFPIAGRLADRLPVWQPMALGLLLFALSCWLLRGVDTDTPFWTLALWILVGRVGLGPDHAQHECRGAAGAAAALPRPGRGRRSISPGNSAGRWG